MSSFPALTWVLLALIVWGIYAAVRGMLGGRGKIADGGSFVCATCGTRGEPKTVTRGSLLIEIVLWICLIVPGIVYSLWRVTSRTKGCPACGNTMIPVNTPAGKKLIA